MEERLHRIEDPLENVPRALVRGLAGLDELSEVLRRLLLVEPVGLDGRLAVAPTQRLHVLVGERADLAEKPDDGVEVFVEHDVRVLVLAFERDLAGENAELLEMFNAGLANIREDGTYDEIVATYLGE